MKQAGIISKCLTRLLVCCIGGVFQIHYLMDIPFFHACCRLYLNVPLNDKKHVLFGTTKKGDDHDDTGQYDSHLDGLRPLQ